ncbi:MAG: hypothetical protein JXR03_18335 [Cyclobacteriaceae bacterium]
MTLKGFLKEASTTEILKMLIKAGLASAPFTGGASQLWSDIETKERDKIIIELLDNLLKQFKDSEANRNETKVLLEAKIQELSKLGRQDQFSILLRDILKENIPKQLKSIHTFRTKGVNGAIDNILNKPIFSKEIHKGSGRSNFFNNLNEIQKRSRNNISRVLGIQGKDDRLEHYLKDPKFQINVAFSPIMLAVSAIFFHLKHVRGYNICLEHSFAHAIELAENIIEGSIKKIHACVLADAPSLQIINSTRPKFDFVQFLPRTDQKVIAYKNSIFTKPKINEGDYFFIGDKISTTLLHFEEWNEKGIIDDKRVNIETLEPHESIDLLKEKNPEKKLLVWSPHWQMYDKLNLGQVQMPKAHDEYWFDSMLFLQHSFSKNRKRANAFLLAINDAWFSLLEDKNLDIVIRLMLEDENYVKCIRRFTGYDQLLKS